MTCWVAARGRTCSSLQPGRGAMRWSTANSGVLVVRTSASNSTGSGRSRKPWVKHATDRVSKLSAKGNTAPAMAADPEQTGHRRAERETRRGHGQRQRHQAAERGSGARIRQGRAREIEREGLRHGGAAFDFDVGKAERQQDHEGERRHDHQHQDGRHRGPDSAAGQQLVQRRLAHRRRARPGRKGGRCHCGAQMAQRSGVSTESVTAFPRAVEAQIEAGLDFGQTPVDEARRALSDGLIDPVRGFYAGWV